MYYTIFTENIQITQGEEAQSTKHQMTTKSTLPTSFDHTTEDYGMLLNLLMSHSMWVIALETSIHAIYRTPSKQLLPNLI